MWQITLHVAYIKILNYSIIKMNIYCRKFFPEYKLVIQKTRSVSPLKDLSMWKIFGEFLVWFTCAELRIYLKIWGENCFFVWRPKGAS
jgi:hypothetical protein